VPTTASASQIRTEFDAIAQLTPEHHYPGPSEAWLLTNLPLGRGTVLEIGCGVGDLSRRLTSAFDSVIAIDFSEGMITEAKRRTAPNTPIEYACADMFEWLRRSGNSYDCIITVATLHHVDLRAALREMAWSVKPGGRLLVIDLFSRTGWRHFFVNAAAWVIERAHEVRVFRGMKPWRLTRAFWRHGRNETYLSLPEVKHIAGEELPGAQVRGHLLWRYSIVWDRSA